MKAGQYLDVLNADVNSSVESLALEPAMIEYALAMKQPSRLSQFALPQEFSGYTLEDAQIMKARKVGNQLVRLSILSAQRAGEDAAIPYIGNLSSDDQMEILEAATTPVDQSGIFPLLAISDADVRAVIAATKKQGQSFAQRAQAVGAYMNVLPGSFPPTGWPKPLFGGQDVTFTQAFGRNSYLDSELAQLVEKRSRLETDQEMFAYLKDNSFDPGLANEDLADEIVLQLQDSTTLIEQALQWEVAFSLWDRYPQVYQAHRLALHPLWPRAGAGAYRTFEVKEDSIDVMKQAGLYNPYEFAHQDMMVRSLGILGKLGIQADILAADIRFDPNSTQYQIRGERQWLVREFMTRVEHVLFNRVRF